MNEQENQFRIGGVYRQKNGQLMKLGVCALAPNEPGEAWAQGVDNKFGEGFRRLKDGTDTKDWFGNLRDLIPGELTQTASGWVALGAEKQEPNVRAEAIALYEAKLSRELREVEPASVDLDMIARDGPTKPKTYAPFTPFGSFSDAPVSTAKPNPFPTTLRSPDCDSGPSDHLNASRHQMAGMSKS